MTSHADIHCQYLFTLIEINILDKFEGPTCFHSQVIGVWKDLFSNFLFDLYDLDCHPPKFVRREFTLRFIIPENFKSLASAVQKP